jgi:hypothetical protein
MVGSLRRATSRWFRICSGLSGESLKIKYKEAQQLFQASDYIVDHSPSSYAVDGQNGNTICGPARTNNNFDIVNCYFAYNPLDLAKEYMVYVFPGRSSGVKGRNEHVGGITMLVSKRSRSGWSVTKLHPDPSGCGSYLAADLNNADGRRVRVMGVYLPVESSDKQFNEYSLGTAAEERSIQKSSLARKVRDHIGTLPKAGQSPTVAGWLWQRFERLTRNSDWEVILVGDFNRPLTKRGGSHFCFSKKVCQPWDHQPGGRGSALSWGPLPIHLQQGRGYKEWP